MISIIAAVSDNGVIGRHGVLPWRQKADLVRFKKLTTGHPIVMGSTTFYSIGRPLPNRDNYVLTRNPKFHHEDVKVLGDLDEVDEIEGNVFIIGGGVVYGDSMHIADRLYITEIHTDIEDGDAFFPEIPKEKWREISRESHEKDADNEYAYDFVTYEHY